MSIKSSCERVRKACPDERAVATYKLYIIEIQGYLVYRENKAIIIIPPREKYLHS